MTTSTSSPTSSPTPRLVWDLPLRLFHWLLAASFAGAWLTAEADGWRLAHISFGLTMVGLVGFRLVWGLVGPRPARFASFVRSPRAAWAYLRDLSSGTAPASAGHNPAGAYAILALLGLALLAPASGWLLWQGAGWLEDIHEGVASLMLGLVIVHIAAVLLSSLLHRENLAAAMLHGRKRAAPEEAIRGPQRIVAALLLAAVLGFWITQWRAPETFGFDAATMARHEESAHGHHGHGHGHDDD